MALRLLIDPIRHLFVKDLDCLLHLQTLGIVELALKEKKYLFLHRLAHQNLLPFHRAFQVGRKMNFELESLEYSKVDYGKMKLGSLSAVVIEQTAEHLLALLASFEGMKEF